MLSSLWWTSSNLAVSLLVLYIILEVCIIINVRRARPLDLVIKARCIKGEKTMLKTNSKKVIQKIKNWIIENSDFEGYDDLPVKNPSSFADYAANIYFIFNQEKANYRDSEQEAFIDWLAGLPASINSADYYYNNSSVAVLADILEETSEERSRFDELEAEHLMSYLIYKAIIKEAK